MGLTDKIMGRVAASGKAQTRKVINNLPQKELHDIRRKMIDECTEMVIDLKAMSDTELRDHIIKKICG